MNLAKREILGGVGGETRRGEFRRIKGVGGWLGGLKRGVEKCVGLGFECQIDWVRWEITGDRGRLGEIGGRGSGGVGVFWGSGVSGGGFEGARSVSGEHASVVGGCGDKFDNV